LTWWFEPLSPYETFFQDKEIECDPRPSMRRELLRRLSERYGLRFHRRVFDGEDLATSLLVVMQSPSPLGLPKSWFGERRGNTPRWKEYDWD
jgi:hypothetical protein